MRLTKLPRPFPYGHKAYNFTLVDERRRGHIRVIPARAHTCHSFPCSTRVGLKEACSDWVGGGGVAAWEGDAQNPNALWQSKRKKLCTSRMQRHTFVAPHIHLVQIHTTEIEALLGFFSSIHVDLHWMYVRGRKGRMHRILQRSNAMLKDPVHWYTHIPLVWLPA